jgi:hypothetical protein
MNYYEFIQLDGSPADHEYAIENYLYLSSTTLGHRRTRFGQYLGLCFSLPYGRAIMEIPKYDEELREFHVMIYGALCHHKKHSDE